MPSESEALAAMLREAEALLRSYGEINWADRLAKDAKFTRFHDGFGMEHLLSTYGGMRSLNDVLQRINEGAEVLASRGDNDHFDELRRESRAGRGSPLSRKPVSRLRARMNERETGLSAPGH